MGGCEPGQIREEAALSTSSHVPWGCLVRANCRGRLFWAGSKGVHGQLAVLDGESAVPCNPESAIPGSNALPRPSTLCSTAREVALTAGSHAMGGCEPGQVREEAALSITSHVPWGRLVRANCRGRLFWAGSKWVHGQQDRLARCRPAQSWRWRGIGRDTLGRVGARNGDWRPQHAIGGVAAWAAVEADGDEE